MRHLSRRDITAGVAVGVTMLVSLGIGLVVGWSIHTANKTIVEHPRKFSMVMVDPSTGKCRRHKCAPSTTTTTVTTTPTVTVAPTTTTAPLPTTTAPTPTTTTTTTTTTTVPPPPSGWKTAVNTDFTSGALPAPWVAYGPFANGASYAAGYYLPSHAVVANGYLALVQKYESSGPAAGHAPYSSTGAGWYQGTVYAASAADSIDHRVTFRMRAVSTGGVTSHRNLPLWWTNVPSPFDFYTTAGEEDDFESDGVWWPNDGTGEQPRSFFHYSNPPGNWIFTYFIWPRIDVSQWHTYTFTRLNHRITLTVDGTMIFDHQYTSIELPDYAKHPVFQQENPAYQPPAGTTGSEEIQIDWATVEVPS